MKLSSLMRPAVLALILAAASAAPSLLDAWRNAPLERGHWPLFVLWLLPCAGWWHRGNPAAGEGSMGGNPLDLGLLSAAALLALVAGSVLEINVLRQLAFALGLAALAPRRRWGFFPWLAASIAWMPALGWVTAGWPAALPDLFRWLVAFCGVAAWFLSSRVFSPQPRALS